MKNVPPFVCLEIWRKLKMVEIVDKIFSSIHLDGGRKAHIPPPPPPPKKKCNSLIVSSQRVEKIGETQKKLKVVAIVDENFSSLTSGWRQIKLISPLKKIVIVSPQRVEEKGEKTGVGGKIL